MANAKETSEESNSVYAKPSCSEGEMEIVYRS